MPAHLLTTAGATAIPGTLGAPLTSVDDVSGRSLAALRDEVQLATRNRLEISPARVATFINDAYRDMCSEISFQELETEIQFTTVADQMRYLLPERVHVVHAATIQDESFYANSWPLQKLTETQFRAEPDLGFSDYPDAFLQVGRLLVLWPIPSGAFTVTLALQAKPAPLVNNSDMPVLDPEWHHALILRATSYLFSAVMEPERAAEKLNEYAANIRPKLDKRGENLRGVVASVTTPRNRQDARMNRRRDRGYNW